jgi:hypothetical protein
MAADVRHQNRPPPILIRGRRFGVLQESAGCGYGSVVEPVIALATRTWGRYMACAVQRNGLDQTKPLPAEVGMQ